MLSTYLAIKHYIGGYCWEKTFVYAFVGKIVNPAEINIELSFARYFQRLYWYVAENVATLKLAYYVVFIVIGLGSVFWLKRSQACWT